MIEQYKEKYKTDIIEICYKTGFYGEDLSMFNLFKDKKLFAMRFVLHYTHFQPDYCFVYKENNKIAGYIIGTDDTKKQEADFLKTMYPKMLLRMYLFTWWYSITSFRNIKRFSKPNNESVLDDTLLDTYPAHLHMNVLPGYQGRGIGQQLLDSFMSALREKNVAGIHLGTSSENKKAVPFYEKNNFVLLRQLDGDMWGMGTGVKSLIYGLRLNE